MKCCAECFGDRGLRNSIIPSRSTDLGKCSYCETEACALVLPSQLAEYFELLISAYRRDEAGKLLITWFREDWNLFEHPRMDDSRAKDLLAEILDDGEIVRQAFSPKQESQADRLGEWGKLREELMYHNRFFPKTSIDLQQLELYLSLLTLKADEIPTHWYRARIQRSDTQYLAVEMGAPPRRVVSHGRANPAGIPYLYLGSASTTAISEVRPHTGELVCVADVVTSTDLKLVDLRRPRKTVTPFLLEETDISRMRSDLPYLEKLGEELTRPVLPQAAAIDYTPSQYLCEFIKRCGYSGVVYRSSVSDGMNLALFDPSAALFGDVRQYRVTRVSVDVIASAQTT